MHAQNGPGSRAVTALRIALFNSKGGCGKTTLSWNLAMGLSLRGRTLLLDIDPQGSTGHWADWAQEGGQFALEVRDGSTVIDPVEESYRYVVYDCPPQGDGARIGAVLAEADVVLLPVLPSPLDLWASGRSAELLRDLQAQRPALQAYFLLNQVEANSALSRASTAAITEMGLPVLATQIGRRAIYRSAAVEGLSVYQMGKRGAPAMEEIERLIKEILE